MNRNCPTCNACLNHTAGFGVPEPGDYTICAYCRTVLLFDSDMSLVLYKTYEQLNIEEKQQLQDAVEAFKRLMNRENN